MPPAGSIASVHIACDTGLKRTERSWRSVRRESVDAAHSFFNLAGEDVDLKVLRTSVTLGEGETVTVHSSLSSTSAEQHLVNGERGDFCSRGLVHNPGENHRTQIYLLALYLN